MPDKQQDISRDNYDRGITPAETAARKEREGDLYKKTVHDEQATEHVDTTGGYTSDNEGLVNNFAIEPEMYINEPGDLRQEEEELNAERAEEIDEMRDTNKQGELTLEEDKRGKGTGII